MNSINIPRGNDRALPVTVTQDGSPKDITGWTIFFTVKSDTTASDTDAEIKKTITSHTNPAQGSSSIVLTNDDTDMEPNRYVYDIKIKDASGNLQSSNVGSFIIEERVTDRES